MGRPGRAIRALQVTALVGITGGSAPARAGGTFLMFEGSAGASAPAHDAGASGWTAGLAFGPTLKLSRSPLRFHLLGNVQARRIAVSDARSRADFLYFLSQRTVLPVVFPLRLYLETGLGVRQAVVERASEAGLIELEPLLALALGAQLRWTREWSVGLRAGWEPAIAASPALDLGAPRAPDLTFALTLGAHF